MILAAIGDIHGNAPALEAVLRAIDDEGIQTVVNTGDCVVGHPWPNEAIDVLQGRNIPTVQGRADRNVVRFLRSRERLQSHCPPAEFQALSESYTTCRSANIEYLRGLPRALTPTIDGATFHLCHGSLSSQSEQLTADDSIDRLRRQRELSAGTPLIICGGSHRGYQRRVDGTLFVDPGSVGLSEGDTGAGRSASFAIVSTETETWMAELHRIEY